MEIENEIEGSWKTEDRREKKTLRFSASTLSSLRLKEEEKI